MKIIKIKFFLVAVSLFGTMTAIAKVPPPPPPEKILKPAAPIDDYLLLLVLTALIFGIYTIYSITASKKKPV